MAPSRSVAKFLRCPDSSLPLSPLALAFSLLDPARQSLRPVSSTHATRRAMSQTATCSRRLNIDTINQNVRQAKYAVRGEIAVRSEKYRAQLAKSQKANGDQNGSLPFDSVVSANIGNPQQLDQKPITFFRQVASLLENPLLLEREDVLRDHLGYKQDVIDRARWLLREVKSVGAYSQSHGAPGIRQSVANFIERRDGYPSDPASVYLTGGASSGVNTLMNVLCASPSTGVLVPIPQYPLYTATLALHNAHAVPYYLDESSAWSTDVSTVKKALVQARSSGIDVRALVVINPGNPTGASLDQKDIRSMVELAADEDLVLLADEVYQTNIFEGTFYSFKRALRDAQKSDTSGRFNNVELASLHSTSKGMVGECGHRGGYMELIGFDPEVLEQIYKFISIQLCPPVIGQCIVEMMVNPPKPGDPSHDLYAKEYNGVFEGLKQRAMALYHAFEEMQGVHCQPPQGSMYLYPTIKLPEKAVQAAEKEGKQPDEFYVSKMLDRTGVCMVAGTGFGQEPGTAHFRTTFLAPGTEWVERITRFHQEFMGEFA